MALSKQEKIVAVIALENIGVQLVLAKFSLPVLVEKDKRKS